MELLQLKIALGNEPPSEFPREYLTAAFIKRKISWYQQDLAILSGKTWEYLILLKALFHGVRKKMYLPPLWGHRKMSLVRDLHRPL